MAVFYLELEDSMVCVATRFEQVLATQIFGPTALTSPTRPTRASCIEGGLAQPNRTFPFPKSGFEVATNIL